MKKLIVAVLLVAAFALPAGAARDIAVLVDGVQLEQEAIMHNGSVYVPLRAAAESLGFGVVWDGQQVFVNIPDAEPVEVEPAKLTRPEIVGNKEFTKAINDALDILYEKDVAHYMLVLQNVDAVKQSDVNGIMPGGLNPDARSVGREVIIFPSYIESEYFTPKLIAATLTHEAVHAAGYNAKGLFRNISNEEVVAYENEITTLKLVGAQSWIIKDRERLVVKYKN